MHIRLRHEDDRLLQGNLPVHVNSLDPFPCGHQLVNDADYEQEDVFADGSSRGGGVGVWLEWSLRRGDSVGSVV